MDQRIQPFVADEISLEDLFADFARARAMFAVLMLVFMLIGAAVGVFADKEYEATIVVSPVMSQGGSSGLSSLTSQYGALAAMAGVALPGAEKKDEALAALQSEQLTESYIHDNDLLPILFASQWDAAGRKWKSDTEPPTLWTANRYFANNVRTVTDNTKTGMVEMSIRWKDPQQAAQWANGLVKLVNTYMRGRAIDEAQREIDYLNEQAAKTNVLEQQKAIYTLLEQEINQEMLARGREEYGLKIIDPAQVPERPSSGGPIRLGALGLVLGAFLGAVIVFVRDVLRSA